jgi:predicted nuclease with RNAse H fold
MLFLGYDPGGKSANGAAILTVNNDVKSLQAATLDSVDDTLEWFDVCLSGGIPEAIGIDSFLSWETGLSGWRGPDKWLRKMYPEVKSSVMASNSTFGSMAIQGMAMAVRLRDRSDQVILNETHPKVLYYALSRQKYSFPGPNNQMVDWLKKTAAINEMPNSLTEHAWDAAISAWITYQGYKTGFSSDLMSKTNNPILPAGKVHYHWPDGRIPPGPG